TDQPAAAGKIVTPANSQDISSLRGVYPVDAGHSGINFSIKHWMSRAHGIMQIDSGLISMPGDPAAASIRMAINVPSINTMNVDRDDAMRGEQWFDAKQHPQISFQSTSIGESDKPGYAYVATGNLTCKGVTKP